MFAIASTPRSAREPCAATPVVSTSSHTNPVCAFSIKLRPPPVPRSTPTTDGRPGTGSTISTSRPAADIHDATYWAMAVSPLPDGTRSGLTDSIATSSQMRSDKEVAARLIARPPLKSRDGTLAAWSCQVAHRRHVSGVTGEPETTELPAILNGAEQRVVVVSNRRSPRRVVGVRDD